MKNKILKILGILLVINLVASVYLYIFIWRPHQKMSDLDWLQSTPPQEQRELAHTVLSQPFGNFHDALVILNSHGNKESLPYLLNTLTKFDDTSDFVECTQSHCVDALKKITGEDFGSDYDKWKEYLK